MAQRTMALKTKSSVRQALPVRVSFFYGWVIVAVSALGMFFSGPGQTYSISTFIDGYIRDFHMDRAIISGIYSGATLCAGILLFGVGKLIDKYGRRTMSVVVGLLLAAACFFNSFNAGAFMLFFGFFFLRLFGQGSMTLIPSTLVPQWFVRYRGRAVSLMGLGGLIGAAVFPPLNNWMAVTWGWHTAWRVLGLLICLGFVPIAFFFIRNRPEDVGLQPDNGIGPAKASASQASVADEVSWTVSEAIRTKAFWFLMFGVVVPALVNTGLTFQIFSILGEKGVDRTSTSFVLSLVPIVAFVCQLISGYFADRIKTHRMIAFSFIFFAAVLAYLLMVHSAAGVFVFASVWGMSQGIISVPLGVVWSNYYGRNHLGSIGSITMIATVIGSAFGPIPFGWAYEYFGGYQQMIALMIILPVVAAILAFFAPQPEKKR